MTINIHKVYKCSGCTSGCYVLVLKKLSTEEAVVRVWTYAVKRLYRASGEEAEGPCAVASRELTPVPENEAIKYLL